MTKRSGDDRARTIRAWCGLVHAQLQATPHAVSRGLDGVIQFEGEGVAMAITLKDGRAQCFFAKHPAPDVEVDVDAEALGRVLDDQVSEGPAFSVRGRQALYEAFFGGLVAAPQPKSMISVRM